MSFYGRIDRTDRVSFVTDKIYPNRKAMDNNALTDGVFIGRYVLVEYEQDLGYDYNYQVDKDAYPGMGRGYDSTVWQKIYADEKEKYVMVAELNSVVPTMSIIVDAPTLNPLPPHFDIESNTASYKLHLQPSWGFKVKEAESADKSDSKMEVDTVEWVDGAETLNEVHKTYDGAIFYNKAGFDPSTHYDNLNTEEDKIEITLANSGREYDVNHSNEKNLDTYELSMMLPSLGKAMSDVWDIMYGPGEEDEEDKTIKHRLTQIGWDVDGGPRLVQSSRDINNSGFEYDIQGASSMAGCINSVHDLMGKIIVNDSSNTTPDETILNALVNRIYYRDRKYWMKNIACDYKKPNGDIVIEDMREFGDNYYYKTGDNYYLEQEGYQSGNTYYSLEDISPITFYGSKWEPKKYYKDYNENELKGYILEDSENPNETINYYDIKGVTNKTTTRINNNKTGYCFFPGDYYNKEVYQTIFPTDLLHEGSSEDARGKGLFYLFETDGKSGYLPFDDKVAYNDILQKDGMPVLVYWENYKIETATQPGSSELVITYDFNGATKTDVRTIPFKEDTFYYQDGDKWLLLNDIKNLKTNYTYYPLEELGWSLISLNEPFYEPNTYYYRDGLDYMLGIDKDQRLGIQYYKIGSINQAGADITFYEPNKYYYENEDGDKVLDTSPTMTPDRTYYYDIYTLYVIKDSNNIYPIGSVWNSKVPLPEDGSVELGYKVDKYEWKELKGFSRTLNTINGLILKINQIIKFDDKNTRDTSTVAGCINKLNDIIWKFNELKPNHLAVVNENGQFTSSPFVGDKWIQVAVNGSNSVNVEHIGPCEIVEKNAERDIENKTPLFGETFNIEDWHFDDKGHKVESTLHTITIPVGSLNNLEATGSSVLTGISMIPETGAITQEHADVGTLLLTKYKNDTNGATIVATDSLNDAIKNLEDRIIKEEKSRDSIIDSLDMAENVSATKFVSKISQADGKVAVERAAAGTLVLSDSADAIATQTADIIKGTDSIISAFGKVEAQIKSETEERKKAINTLNNDLTAEINNCNAAINKEIQDRDNAIKELDSTLSTKETYEVITTISQTDGKLAEIKTTKIGELTLSGYELPENNISRITYSDDINTAFGKLQSQNLSQNTNIENNNKAIKSLEDLVGDTAVETQIAEAIKAENLGQYALVEDLNNLTEKVSNNEKTFTDDINYLKEQVNSNTSEIENLYKISDDINNNIEENCVNKIAELDTEYREIFKTIDEITNNHSEQINSLQENDTLIIKEVKDNYLRTEDFNNELETINSKYITLSETSEAHTSAIENLYVRNDGINKEVKENYVRKEDFESTVKMLLEKITQLDNKIIELEKLVQG